MTNFTYDNYAQCNNGLSMEWIRLEWTQVITAIIIILYGFVTVKLFQTITWNDWCNELRNLLFDGMKMDLQQIRNHDLDRAHKEGPWTDYNMPKCINCYKRYINEKTKSCSSNTNLLFALDSTIILLTNCQSFDVHVTVSYTFCKIMFRTVQLKNNSYSSICSSFVEFTCFFVGYVGRFLKLSISKLNRKSTIVNKLLVLK